MLRDLFVNTTIIISFIFVGGQLLRDKPLKEGFSFLQKCVIGIFTGILGVLLMHFGVHIEDIMLDLRYLAVILAIIVGGPVASSITVTIILITRLIFTEYSLASELACYTIIKWNWCYLYCKNTNFDYVKVSMVTRILPFYFDSTDVYII